MVSLGNSISKIHMIGIQSELRRKNDMLALSSWDYILEKFKQYDGKSKSEITHVINTIKNLRDKFPKSLRTSLIHGTYLKIIYFFKIMRYRVLLISFLLAVIPLYTIWQH